MNFVKEFWQTLSIRSFINTELFNPKVIAPQLYVLIFSAKKILNNTHFIQNKYIYTEIFITIHSCMPWRFRADKDNFPDNILTTVAEFLHLILFVGCKISIRSLLLFTENYRKVSGICRDLLLHPNRDHYRNRICVL